MSTQVQRQMSQYMEKFGCSPKATQLMAFARQSGVRLTYKNVRDLTKHSNKLVAEVDTKPKGKNKTHTKPTSVKTEPNYQKKDEKPELPAKAALQAKDSHIKNDTIYLDSSTKQFRNSREYWYAQAVSI
eukprot:604478_1